MRTCPVPMLRRRRNRRFPENRSAFSLIELLAVVAILGLFAAVTTISLRGSLFVSRQQSEWQQLQSMDSTLRAQCRRLRQPAALRVDLSTGVWDRHISGMTPLRVNETRHLQAVSTHGQAAQSGEVTIFYRADGTSDSYAVQLTGDGASQWRLVCGGTGQWIEDTSHETLRTLLRP